MTIRDKDQLLDELHQLENEHVELDHFIDKNPDEIDELAFQRLKKRRLLIRDRIAQIKHLLYPDILA